MSIKGQHESIIGWLLFLILKFKFFFWTFFICEHAGADGKMRIVHYIADHDGFRVDIKSNEQGMKTGVDSANAIVNGKDPGKYQKSPH